MEFVYNFFATSRGKSAVEGIGRGGGQYSKTIQEPNFVSFEY